MNEEKARLSTTKTIAAIILAIVVLVIAQIIAEVIASLVVMLPGIPVAAGYAITGIFYPVFALLGVKLLCSRLLRMSLNDCKMPKFTLRPIWVAAAIIMPCLVSFVLCLTPRHWQNNMLNRNEVWQIVTRAIFFTGMRAGLAEEFTIYNYVLDTDSFLITGGDFGVEASAVAVLAYLVFAVLAIYLMRKRGETASEML